MSFQDLLFEFRDLSNNKVPESEPKVKEKRETAYLKYRTAHYSHRSTEIFSMLGFDSFPSTANRPLLFVHLQWACRH